MASKSPQPDITLFRAWADTGVYVWSPFVTKLELRLRTSNISYTTAAGNPRTAPTGKIPYVELKYEGEPPTSIGDSALIAESFEENGLIKSIADGLDGKSRAYDLAIKALVEDKLYFFNMRERWIDNFYIQRDWVFGSLPYPMKVLIGYMVYRSHCKTLYGQGTGRFSADDAAKFRGEIWVTLNGLLEESRRKARKGSCFWCLGGNEPTDCDMSVFGFVTSALVATSSPESKKLVLSLPAVVDYATRIHETYFPDYKKWDASIP